MASICHDQSEAGSDISDWEIEEGLPQFEDHFIQKYFQGREALLDQEKTQRSDAAFRQSLTPLATEACAIVSRILAEEHQTIWTSELQDDLARQEGVSLHPGMMFTLARDTMEKTKSWKIVKRMPKGALLHAHQDAMIDVDWLIDEVLATEGMVMLAEESLYGPMARVEGKVIFRYSKGSLATASSIWSEEYQASHPVSMKEAAASFPDGATEGFKTWLKSRCTITSEESIKHHHGLDAVWRKFTSCFPPLDSMEYYEPILRASMQRLLRQLVDDGLRWVDFRSTFAVDFRLEGCEELSKDSDDLVRIFSEELKKFKATQEGRNFWGYRFIWTSLRSWGKRKIVDHMKQCIIMKKAYPELIAGYDVVGQEDMGRSLADLTPELFWFKKRCFENGVDIPYFFHAGECLGDGDETDHNLFDAILLGTRRIGHGFSLYKHPLLTEMVKTKKILIESCPISNEVLRLTSSIKSHPLPALLARGVSCALSNDDPAVLGQRGNGVTDDFWQALQGWENLGLAGLGSLAENSVRWAAYEDQTTKEWTEDIKKGVYGEGIRASRLREWHLEFNKFCEWILLEYALEYGGDED
ncbi:MAG: hypothetical protein ALECFALPRED_009056 [Alectoria fallacina]|uniref:adenosine deaminase n=1 Tax=Alectoria fallacina TaxID=1903189 RepID=A0A8H3J5U5_9LECA|nr:MAG: hypothetical protein ALECFALPRED_009056 [Alectoria fallacina]